MTSDWRGDSPSSDHQDLVESWIDNAEASVHAHNVDRLARYVPELGWQSILAILELPDSQSHLDALAEPLGVLIAQYGTNLIVRIESEAAVNLPLRRCLAELRSSPVFRVPAHLWERLSAAAGTAVGPIPPHVQDLYDELPDLAQVLSFDPHPIAPEQTAPLTIDEFRAQASGWIAYQQTFWAWEELRRVAEEEGCDAVWPLIVQVVQQGSDGALGNLGAGRLEDLLREHGPQVIDRIEAEAADSTRFRYCLSFVWPVAMAEGVWARVVKARGNEPQRG